MPPDDRWRENPYWRFDTRDIDPSEIDAWNEARLYKKGLETKTCRRLCRYFLIYAENVISWTWWARKDPIARAIYLKEMAPVVAHARRAVVLASKREDVDALYDVLGSKGINPV